MREQHPFTVKVKRRRILYFEFGLIIALSFCLWAFNTNYEVIELRPTIETDPFDQWDTIYTMPIRQEEDMPKPKTEEAPTPKPITDQFKLVDNKMPVQEPSDVLNINLDSLNSTILAQVVPKESFKEDYTIHKFASKLPEFNGGIEAMFGFISANFKYPELAKENGIQGKIVISFVVEKDGSLSNFKIEESPGYGLGEEGLRVAEHMPNWIPGENNFRPVRVMMRMPIKAQLK